MHSRFLAAQALQQEMKSRQDISNADSGSLSTGMNGENMVSAEELLKIRRESHRHVERRRREQINEVFGQLSQIVGRKNKIDVLKSAVHTIQALRKAETSYIEKLRESERKIAELQETIDKLSRSGLSE